MAVKPIPEGYHTATPYLTVDDAAAAIEYYKKAFGARERSRMDTPDGKIGHAELEIGDSRVMLSDSFPQGSVRPPSESGARRRASSCTSRTSTRSYRRQSTRAPR